MVDYVFVVLISSTLFSWTWFEVSGSSTCISQCLLNAEAQSPTQFMIAQNLGRDVSHPLSTHQQYVRPCRRFGHVASDREVLGQSSVSETS